MKVSNESEALERIGNKLATGGAVINQTFDFEIIKQALTELETLKSQNRNAYKEGYEQGKFDARMEETPTADEICKALSEWLKEKIFLKEDNSFYYTKIGKFYNNDVVICEWNLRDKTITFYQSNIPPHLITLIGKFYEKEVGK